MIVTVAVWDIVPLAPVTVTVYVPAGVAAPAEIVKSPTTVTVTVAVWVVVPLTPLTVTV